MIIDFNAKLAKKKQEAEAAELARYFLDEIMPYLNRTELLALMDALESRDEAKYLAITEPIIRRKVMAEVNGVGRK